MFIDKSNSIGKFIIFWFLRHALCCCGPLRHALCCCGPRGLVTLDTSLEQITACTMVRDIKKPMNHARVNSVPNLYNHYNTIPKNTMIDMLEAKSDPRAVEPALSAPRLANRASSRFVAPTSPHASCSSSCAATLKEEAQGMSRLRYSHSGPEIVPSEWTRTGMR